jgi:multiple sugar transport system permease protein
MRSSSLRRLSFLTLRYILLYAILIAVGIFFMIPFGWMMSTSLKQPSQIWIHPPKWIPEPIVWGNFPRALKMMKFMLQLKNTLIYSGITIVGVVLSCSLVAYGFARFEFPGRDFLFLLMISTIMIPPQVTIIPTFILFTLLRWTNSLRPLIIPAFFGVPFFIFLLRQFFMTIPRDLDEAAIIDGSGYFRIYWQIILPLSKPAIAAIVIFQFVGTWNDFFGPLVYLNDESKYTLSIGLRAFQGVYSTEWALLMAASIVVVMPCLLIYFFAQKYFIQGVVFSGIRG